MADGEPRPQTFWQIFETIDGEAAPCCDKPVWRRNPNSLLPDLYNLRRQGRNVHIQGVSYTLAEGVQALLRGISPEFVQQLTGWSDEDMVLVMTIAQMRENPTA